MEREQFRPFNSRIFWWAKMWSEAQGLLWGDFVFWEKDPSSSQGFSSIYAVPPQGATLPRNCKQNKFSYSVYVEITSN